MNYLCVHKKIRSKRLAPVLIKELTRRVNRHDGWQAVYTAGTCIPTPITKATYPSFYAFIIVTIIDLLISKSWLILVSLVCPIV